MNKQKTEQKLNNLLRKSKMELTIKEKEIGVILINFAEEYNKIMRKSLE